MVIEKEFDGGGKLTITTDKFTFNIKAESPASGSSKPSITLPLMALKSLIEVLSNVDKKTKDNKNIKEAKFQTILDKISKK